MGFSIIKNHDDIKMSVWIMSSSHFVLVNPETVE